jgi:acetyltransferase-like isoleucine patch superfamily enzyme
LKIKYLLGKLLLLIPIVNKKQFVYQLLGVRVASKGDSYFIGNPMLVGDYSNLLMHNHTEIERNCFLLAKDKIEIGENSTISYGVSVLTSADPNAPYNALSKLYHTMKAPVVIGKDCWIGANSTILPGVTIGDFSVVAAGSVVTKNVPSGTMVAGNPAVVKKYLKA